jgi:hypothetical protein
MNASTTIKAGITVHIEEDGLYIEQVLENGDVNTYCAECTTTDMLEWYEVNYGRYETTDHFEGSYFQTSSRVDNDAIIDYIKDEPKLQREFANSIRDKWVACEE